MEKNIAILGSTGSIGTQTLEVARAYPEIRVRALTAHSNIELLERQAREFKPELVCVTDGKRAAALRLSLADTDIRVVGGRGGLIEAAALKSADTVVTAVVGISGLEPTIEAIRAKKDIALANKETLVAGGHIVTRLAGEYGVKILPVDSEHSAIFQSLQGEERKIKRILLTASGGSFFGKKREELRGVTPKEAMKNPNWDMGAKVTIDSSTLANKGLEVIEARWLFGVDVDKIKVLVHRQSVLHSAVEFEDNAVIAQLGAPDMRLPIQYALTYPRRLPMKGNELDLIKYGALTFEEPDTETFPALELAKRAGREGGLLPTVFNSADEVAVERFMRGELDYLAIPEFIAEKMEGIKNIPEPTLDEILETDREVRNFGASLRNFKS